MDSKALNIVLLITLLFMAEFMVYLDSKIDKLDCRLVWMEAMGATRYGD
jgi:hypothetical protein